MTREFAFAFQPIVDVRTRTVFSYEALIRGRTGQSAAEVLRGLSPGDVAAIDRSAWPVALATAAELRLPTRLNLNATPDGISDGSLASLLLNQNHMDPTRVVLEVTEERLSGSSEQFLSVLNELRVAGVLLAIDDFGAGSSGLNLLADFQPDILKLDRHLVSNVAQSGPRQSIVRAVLQVCDELGIDVIAEGLETFAEAEWFQRAGVPYWQGYLFGQPGFRCLPMPDLGFFSERAPR